ncbi:MAG: alkyl sulfatase dimerization domain-containing protein [Gammaproteobacteria bacterium]|jgi:alkyl sulfatase BDS1-like metallo-beta-lactamase superfamily hydrolase
MKFPVLFAMPWLAGFAAGLLITGPDPAAGETRAATPATKAANDSVEEALPFSNDRDFELAGRGLIHRPDSLVIKDGTGRVVWDLDSYAFLTDGSARPHSANPSHWRQAQLNMSYGLFEVVPGIYQVRGYDLANITFIKGDSGWIVFDPLTTRETSAAALELVTEHLGERPIRAVVYSHTHADHWGGVKGVVTAEEVASGKVQVIAPEGFMEHAVAENLLAGNAMTRRVTYQYGSALPKGARGQMDAAIGKGVSTGTVTLIAPTLTIGRTPTSLTIDGVEMIFQYTPGTEAPAEMNTFFPGFSALWMAENTIHTLHNLYTLRGAEVRDAKAWSHYINEAIEIFSDDAQVLFASHTWPIWGNEELVTFLKKQRDLYGYLHDQTLRLANRGYTMLEIAELMEIPEALSQEWYNRGYHGTYNHNIKAVYQKYLGWYDGNPANLHPLPPEAAAKKYVEYMGGAEAVLARAKQAYNEGDYRWVATVVNHVVFADPTNAEARTLQADALEQLGYQSEGAGWRNSYLAAAYELRHGAPDTQVTQSVNPDTVAGMSFGDVLDFLAVRLDGPRAAGAYLVLNFSFPDLDQSYSVTLENSHLSYVPGKQDPAADATFVLTRKVLDRILLGQATLADAAQAGEAQVTGNPQKFGELMSLMDPLVPQGKGFWFNIVTP